MLEHGTIRGKLNRNFYKRVGKTGHDNGPLPGLDIVPSRFTTFTHFEMSPNNVMSNLQISVVKFVFFGKSQISVAKFLDY